jgi:IQ calmodulin-binding motif
MNDNTYGMKFMISQTEPFDPNKFHGKINGMANFNNFFQDNSLGKITKKKLGLAQKIKEIPEKQTRLKVQQTIREEVSMLGQYTEKIELIIKTTKESYTFKLKAMHESAIKIQKVVRGFLAQKKYNKLWILQKESTLFQLTDSMETTANICFFYLGTNTIPVTFI